MRYGRITIDRPRHHQSSMGTCHYCDREMSHPSEIWGAGDPDLIATQDHIVPRSRGGEDTVPACRRCNGVRGDAPYEIFLFWSRHVNRETNKAAMRRDFLRFLHELAVIGFRQHTGHADDMAEPWGHFFPSRFTAPDIEER